MAEELKPLILTLIDKMDEMLTLQRQHGGDIAQLKTDVARLDAKVEQVDAKLTAKIERVDAKVERVDANLRDEMRQVKEVAGATRLKEIARLDGRIDQLTLDVGLGRPKTAAE